MKHGLLNNENLLPPKNNYINQTNVLDNKKRFIFLLN
jgi:hypothetical protein